MQFILHPSTHRLYPGTYVPGSLTALAQGGSFWLPAPASTTAKYADDLFLFLLAVSAFFFALIVLLLGLFVFLYRRREGAGPAQSPSHNTPLELVWTLIPVAIVIFVFYEGLTGYMEMRTSPRQAYEIQVIAKKWSWLFRYPNGHEDEDLHVPVDQSVRLLMRSEDVIHGLFIPAMRVQMDVVPGRFTTAWFRADKPGEYDLVCAQYCGTKHSTMRSGVIVHPPGEFEKWLTEAGNYEQNLSPVERGKMLYRRFGCWQCHSTDGSAGTGPSFKGVFGHQVTLSDGTSVEADENYVRESILEPQAKIVQGYQPVMNTYKGMLSDDEIAALIEFIKSLK
jgi:cytochrome c oxidase subunit II